MPTLVFYAENVAQGVIERFFVAGNTIQSARAFAEQQRMGTPGTRYKMYVVPETPPEPGILLGIQIAGPLLSPQNVQGGLPTAQPIGQRGRETQGRPRDFSGFDDIPDHALPTAGDAIYGDLQDGTYTDLHSNGQEVPRVIPRMQPGQQGG